MKKLLITICAFSMLQTLQAQSLDRSIKPKAGPAPTINIADAKHFTLPNGLKVYVVENHKLPLVNYSIQLDVDLPNFKEKAGISDIFGEMLSAGTKTRNKQQLLNDIDNIGAYINATASSISGSSLKKSQEKLLELMADCLLNPAFPQEEFEKVKKNAESALTLSSTDAATINNRIAGVANFGANHPYAEITTEQTLKNIQLSDINDYYKNYFRPNVAYLAIVGDVTLDEAKKLVTKYFSNWQKAAVPTTEFPKVASPKGVNVHFAEKAGAVQSEIAVTHPVNYTLGAPDYNAAKLMNYILGGGSSSRLFTNLRESKAWTYGSYSSIDQDKYIGTFSAEAKTRNEVTDSAVVEILSEIQRLKTGTISKEELQGSINYLNGVFALGLSKPATIAQYAINIDKYKLPKDYYKNYMKRTSALTADDIKAAANKYLDPNNINVVVVGSIDEAAKLKKISSTGEVKFYDAYANPVKEVEQKAVSGISADDVLKKYINAIGGEKTIKELKSLQSKGSTTFQGIPVEIEEVIASPSKYSMVQKLSVQGQTFEIISKLNGNKGYMSQMGQRQDLDAEMLAEYTEKADLHADLKYKSNGVEYKVINETEVENQPVYYVEAKDKNGNITKQYYAVNTGYLIREIKTIEMQGQKIESISTYKDYKDVDGLKGYKKPFTVEAEGPQGKMVITYKSIKANVNTDKISFD
jgi:zinc protease